MPDVQTSAEAYASVDQGQRTGIARAFIERLKRLADPKARELAAVEPSTATPEQVAAMHEHAAQHHPEVLGEVLQQPALTGALRVFAAEEIAKRLGTTL